MEIPDLDPSNMEMAMSYIYEVQYIKHVQPERARGAKRKGGIWTIDVFTIVLPLIMGIHVVQVVDEVRKQFFKQLTKLQTENCRMSMAIDAMKSEISSLTHNQQNKLNNIVHMQGEIHIDLINIRLNMQFMTESVTALISNSMEEILTKFRDKSGLNIVRDYEPLDKVGDAEITVDFKGKGKMETDVDVEFSYSLQSPSFDLGVCFTQPTPIEPTKSKKVETYVVSVVYDVLKDTKSVEKLVSPDNSVRYVNYCTLQVSASHCPYQINM
ncbi:Hypothetical predicted protein [Olea europaea subsp. europaea]|uniref:Uncharacterized protein n=1 Tax=Olea europaea subsp. europaea TaxID=158383 RepID=A0A8S0RY09_OLEEU|nr:Hypothetical predicted protein [Olea europaea subsp. europaea]